MITQEHIKQLFDYKDGVLYWKVRIGRNCRVGDISGAIITNKWGSRFRITINRKKYYRSVLVFLWHKGYLPLMIDHRDRDTLNDRIENLRAATPLQNSINTSSRKNSTSKYLGVCLLRGKYWCAQITNHGKKKHLGLFKTEHEAALAYNNEASVIYGEFANLNIICER